MKHAVGLHRPGRRLRVHTDDILLASYPRSGNTWMRFLIANLIHSDRQVNLSNLHRLIVDPDVTVKREIDRAPQPLIVKAQSSFDPRYRRVIYVVRDPREVALSQYHHLRRLRKRGDEASVETFIDHFLTGELNRYSGSWGENVGTWLAAQSHSPGFLLVRYEDVLADAARELTRMADFAGWPATPERVSQAVARSSADKTREREKKQGESYLPLPSAQSGGWRSDLPQPLVARIEAAWGDTMACLGYELVTRDRSALHPSLITLLAAPEEQATPASARAKFLPVISPSHPVPFLANHGSMIKLQRKTSMTKRIVNATKRVLGQTSLGRHFEVFEDDTFVVSFPKSGNTWTRFLIANLLYPEESANFGNIDRLIPESEELTRNQLRRLTRPRIMKSHEYFDSRFRKVIYIVRDPRDVAVSQFHYEKKRRRVGDDYSIKQFVPRFVAGETCDYGSWGSNVASWLVTRQNSPNFLLLRYEDMVTRTGVELARVASFLGVKAMPDLIAQAVERSSADQMRKLESANATASVTQNTRQDIPFVRATGSGGWKISMPESSALELETAWGPLMNWLGYEPALLKIPAASDVPVKPFRPGVSAR